MVKLEPSKRYGVWSGGEIEAFLAETRIPLRVSFVSKPGLLIVPVWFQYRAGSFWLCGPNDSLLVNALRECRGRFRRFNKRHSLSGRAWARLRPLLGRIRQVSARGSVETIRRHR